MSRPVEPGPPSAAPHGVCTYWYGPHRFEVAWRSPRFGTLRRCACGAVTRV